MYHYGHVCISWSRRCYGDDGHMIMMATRYEFMIIDKNILDHFEFSERVTMCYGTIHLWRPHKIAKNRTLSPLQPHPSEMHMTPSPADVRFLDLTPVFEI